jgi:DNA-binding transcriptional LysR family regulator
LVLKQFAYLVALAREKHFGRAAAASHVSQPTLSAAIRNLEEELGAPIVERGHRFNGFTPEGQVVLEHAKRALAECEAMSQGLAELGSGLTGRLRIGAVPTALPVISHLTAPFYARYPRVSVTVLSLTSDEILRGIENFQLEAGVTYLDNEPLPSVRSKPVYAETYSFLTPLEGPYAHRETMTWAEAAEAPLCLLTPDMQNRRIIDGIFRSVGKAPIPEVETNSIFNLCSHTASGHWSSIVPRPLLYFFGIPRNTKALRLIEPDASRTMGLIIADREPLSPLARSLFSMVQPLDPGSLLTPPEAFSPFDR